MEFRIDPDRIKKMITIMVRDRNEEIHDPYNWWNGALNGYLECLGLDWDIVNRIGRGSLILTQILSPKPIVRGEICSGLHF